MDHGQIFSYKAWVGKTTPVLIPPLLLLLPAATNRYVLVTGSTRGLLKLELESCSARWQAQTLAHPPPGLTTALALFRPSLSTFQSLDPLPKTAPFVRYLLVETPGSCNRGDLVAPPCSEGGTDGRMGGGCGQRRSDCFPLERSELDWWLISPSLLLRCPFQGARAFTQSTCQQARAQTEREGASCGLRSLFKQSLDSRGTR